ncbi:iron-sulfur cluster assembly accessory protein [Gloeomargaritales cyanobacterium VI4D9]|nr:iron-sulfur cluster assembly accessory protein [Gloeomargaritales cyanobacterium VI4D9]
MTIRLTPAAVGAIHHWQRRTGQEHTHLRLGVAPGGCAGYSYTLSLENMDKINPESDITTDTMGVTVVIPTHQQELLSGLTLDYTEDLVGGSFRFNNPQAHQTCSCGHSFAITPGDAPP